MAVFHSTNIFLFLIYLRLFIAFFALPIFWYIDSFFKFYGEFWIEKFFKKGIHIISEPVILMSTLFIIGFTTGIILLKLLEKFVKRPKRFHIGSFIEFESDSFNSSVNLYMLLLVIAAFSLKLSTFVFNLDYFEHPFWNGSTYSGIYIRYATHLFLPNVILVMLASLLLVSSDRILLLFGCSVFLFMLLASVNYGSRGLTISVAMVFALVILDKLSISKIKTFIFLSISSLLLILSILYMAEASTDLENRLFSLFLRLDLYHLLVHVHNAPEIILNSGVNDYSRQLGIVSLTDMNTGVGFPIFIGPYTNHPVMVFLSGLVPATAVYLILLLLKTPFRPLAFWSGLYLVLHWVEMDIGQYLSFLIKIAVVLCIFIIAFSFYKFRS